VAQVLSRYRPSRKSPPAEATTIKAAITAERIYADLNLVWSIAYSLMA
jgi:hypothetical protein